MVDCEEIATSGRALLAMTIILSTLSMVGFEGIATSGRALLAMTYTLTTSF